MAWNPNIPIVTNRVQDDLDAIRQNFEALDGLPQDKANILELAGEKDNILGHLADTNNPHNVQAQQVPYSSGVAGFSPADVAAALDALAGVRIVEMDTNSNGTYVRWENGLQVCWFTDTISRTLTEQSGGLYYYEGAWTYPAAFVSSPTVMPGAIDNSGGLYWADLNGTPSPTSAPYQLIGTHTNTARFIGIAIGRWK